MERTPIRARRAEVANSNSLRYSRAPGMRAWTALPERDQTLLRWLVVGSALTAELAALLVYGAPRTARRRLHRLVEEGLVRGYWTANRQRPRGRYAYSLLGPVRAELERRRGKTAVPSAGSPITPTIHQLATHDLLAAFLRAADSVVRSRPPRLAARTSRWRPVRWVRAARCPGLDQHWRRPPDTLSRARPRHGNAKDRD